MTSEQFVTRLEDHWDKSLKVSQRQMYLRKVQRFDEEQLEQIFDRLVEEYTYLPRISQIYKTASDDLKIEHPNERPKARGCSECRFSTWIYVTLHHPISGEPYQAVEPCSCTPRKIKTEGVSSVQFEGNVPQDEEDRIPF